MELDGLPLIREDPTALWEPYACAPGKAVACHLPYCLENLIGLPDKKGHSYTATRPTESLHRTYVLDSHF